MKLNKTTLYESLFLVPFFTFVVINLLLVTNLALPALFAPLSKLPLIFVMLKIVIQYWGNWTQKRKILQWSLVLLVGILTSFVGNQNFPLYFAIFAVGAHGISIEKVEKIYFQLVGIVLFFIIALSLFGIIENEVSFRADGITRRYSLGFGYPSDLAVLITFSFSYWILGKKSIRWIETSCFIMTLGLLYFVLNSRVDVILSFVAFLFAINWKKIMRDHTKLIEKKVYFFPILLFFSVVFLSLAYTPDSTFFVQLDKMLSSRLTLNHLAFENFPIKLFGQEIEMNGSGQFDPSRPYFFIDSGYIQLLLMYGVTYTSVWLLGQVNLLKKTSLMHPKFFYLNILILIHGIITPFMINPVFNPLAILFFADVKKQGRKGNQDNQYAVSVVSQLSLKETGLGKAVNDVMAGLCQDGHFKVEQIDITNNCLFFKHLKQIASSDSKLLYFTPAGSKGGNYRDILYLLTGVFTGKNLILHFHNSSFGKVVNSNWFLFKVNQYLLRKASKIILLGDKHKEMFAKMDIPDNRFISVKNGIDEECFISEQEFFQKSGKNIVYFSNMLPEKGYMEVYHLAQKLADTEYQFYFFGKFFDKNKEQEFLDLIEGEKNITFTPGVYGSEKFDMLKSMDCFILPSRYKDETLPIAMLEARAAGNFIIVTDVGVIDENINPNTSLLLDHWDVSKVFSFLQEGLPALKYEDHKIDKVKQEYNLKNVMDDIVEIIRGEYENTTNNG